MSATHDSPPPEVSRWIRAVRAAWRDLTGGPDVPDATRPTLVAVSGGADSAALAIALATLSEARVVLACVQHDLRPAELVHDDREAVRSLAATLGARLVTEHVSVGTGNVEHEARRARYRALERAATATGCRFIATAHHARDQIETVVMALCRGGAPEALVGVRSRRTLPGSGVEIIRPMLAIDPAPVRAVCEAFGYEPRVDATNADPARMRARVRRLVVPALQECFPAVGDQVTSATQRLAARLRKLPIDEALDVRDEPVEP